jgi:hypothetical protein
LTFKIIWSSAYLIISFLAAYFCSKGAQKIKFAPGFWFFFGLLLPMFAMIILGLIMINRQAFKNNGR